MGRTWGRTDAMGNRALACGKSMQSQCDSSAPIMLQRGNDPVDLQAFIDDVRAAVVLTYTFDPASRRRKLNELREQWDSDDMPPAANSAVMQAIRECIIECEQRVREDRERRRVISMPASCAVQACQDATGASSASIYESGSPVEQYPTVRAS